MYIYLYIIIFIYKGDTRYDEEFGLLVSSCRQCDDGVVRVSLFSVGSTHRSRQYARDLLYGACSSLCGFYHLHSMGYSALMLRLFVALWYL